MSSRRDMQELARRTENQDLLISTISCDKGNSLAIKEDNFCPVEMLISE